MGDLSLERTPQDGGALNRRELYGLSNSGIREIRSSADPKVGTSGADHPGAVSPYWLLHEWNSDFARDWREELMR
jgi:hypothetical protein